MTAWLEEFLWVLAYSKRSQLAIGSGVVSFVTILAVGLYATSHPAFMGVFAPLTEVFRPVFLDRYELEAWLSLGSFLMLAAQSYHKDKKRLFGY